MDDAKRYSEAEFHRQMAAALFNHTWELIEKAGRSPEEDIEMIHMAHASRYHWGQVPEHDAKNLARGEWQVARVHTLLRQADTAMYHARRCLEITEAAGIGDFDIAFAHEAVARAAAAAGDAATCQQHLRLAQQLGKLIAEEDEREIFFNDLGGEPWFGSKLD
jgi:hypothetical protein